MKVKVIGCHGSVAPDYQTTCYYINDRFLIDCGSACSHFSPKEQGDITDIFITHPHLDHIKDICFILENSFSDSRKPLVLRSTKSILNDVHDHMLNDIIWPDFSKIPVGAQKDRYILKFEDVEEFEVIDEVKVTPFRVNHPGNAVGYLIDDGSSQIIFTGDTGPCRKIWEIANECSNLKAIFTEITFPNRMDRLAKASGHFNINQLLDDLSALKDQNVPIFISHLKPLFLSELLEEFKTLATDQMQLLHESDEFQFND